MLARALPDLEVKTIRVLGGGRDIRYQALDAEDKLYDVRRWDSPWLLDIDDRFILKIPTCSEAAERLARARWALGFLVGQTSVPVPELAFSGRSVAFDGYRKLPGHELPAHRLLTLPRRHQLEVAAAVGGFLAEMHQRLPVSESLARGLSEPKSPIPSEQLRRRARRLLERQEDRDFVSLLADALDSAEQEKWPQVVVHDDLHGGNMLWDPVQQRVSGVLDFESVAVGDPHIDFSWWVFLDEELLQCAATAYVRAGPGRLSVERCWLYGAVCDLSDAVWRTERGYPVDDGPITARVHRIRARLPGAVW
jgi:aminoglycoside 2''-phosphotransferase